MFFLFFTNLVSLDPSVKYGLLCKNIQQGCRYCIPFSHKDNPGNVLKTDVTLFLKLSLEFSDFQQDFWQYRCQNSILTVQTNFLSCFFDLLKLNLSDFERKNVAACAQLSSFYVKNASYSDSKTYRKKIFCKTIQQFPDLTTYKFV